jgi:spermidine synthase
VEIDPEVTEMAKKFFGLKTDDDRVNIIHKDARRFLLEDTTLYDAIEVDLYNGVDVPYHLTTLEFMEQLKQKLTGKGIVVMNIPTFRAQERWYKNYMNTILSVFPNSFQANTVLFAFPDNFKQLDSGELPSFATKVVNTLTPVPRSEKSQIFRDLL